jgi:hypothetical protein
MNHQNAMQPLVAIGLALYKALLGLYPRAFRREFASDMIQDFEEAGHEAWINDGWRGVLSLWLFAGADIVRSVPMQWLRSGTVIVTGLALTIATSCAAAVGILDPRVPYTMRPSSPERDELLLLVLATTIVVVIAATIVFSLMFLRPALNRHAGRRRV